MLIANSTRDLNQAARAAARYLKEQGVVLSHAKALDLIARTLGLSHHMAAQASVSAPQQRPTDVGCAVSVVEDLCRVLTHPDINHALYEQGLSDAADAAVVRACPLVGPDVLASFKRDVLKGAFDDLPLDCAPEELLCGNGGSRLAPKQNALAIRLARLLVGSSGQGESPSQPTEGARLEAQFELATTESAAIARKVIAERGVEAALQKLNQDYPAGLSLGPWLLANDSEQGFWCNGFGWTNSRMAASGFTNDEKASLEASTVARFGSYTRWVRFEEVADYPAGDGQR